MGPTCRHSRSVLLILMATSLSATEIGLSGATSQMTFGTTNYSDSRRQPASNTLDLTTVMPGFWEITSTRLPGKRLDRTLLTVGGHFSAESPGDGNMHPRQTWTGTWLTDLDTLHMEFEDIMVIGPRTQSKFTSRYKIRFTRMSQDRLQGIDSENRIWEWRRHVDAGPLTASLPGVWQIRSSALAGNGLIRTALTRDGRFAGDLIGDERTLAQAVTGTWHTSGETLDERTNRASAESAAPQRR